MKANLLKVAQGNEKDIKDIVKTLKANGFNVHHQGFYITVTKGDADAKEYADTIVRIHGSACRDC